jgi:hypothetical protein
MTTKDVIELLQKRETDYLKTELFSQLPGIYAFFYIGNNFPILGSSVSKHQIIYIGKTESSQEKRDAKTHFTTGKTGSSTVRKSIGSILCEKENLKPIPRNDSDYENGRFSHFMFDEASEQIITNWMKNNLALSFFEYPKSKQELEDIETEIIDALVPILNISKNPKNTFKTTLQNLRKNCASSAMKNGDRLSIKTEKQESVKTEISRNFKASSFSGTIYIDNISESDAQVRRIRIKVANLHLFPTEQSGNPKSYFLTFKHNTSEFSAEYIIGSKDGKSRSGVLKLGDHIYLDILKIRAGTNLKITKLAENKYTIERI